MKVNFRTNLLAVFLLIFNSSYAQTLDWAYHLGGDGGDHTVLDMAMDTANNIYVVGYFEDTLTIELGPDSAYFSGGGGDMFCAKFNAEGDFLWLKNWGNLYGSQVSPSGVAEHIAIDNNNNLLITGTFRQTFYFQNQFGTDSIVSNDGSRDPFLLKLDTDGNYVWVKSWGGTSTDRGTSVDIDSQGNVYVGGDIGSNTADLDPGQGVFNFTSTLQADAFLSKFDVNGNFLWAKQFIRLDHGGDTYVEIDIDDNIYVAGEFVLVSDFHPDPLDTVLIESAGEADIYIIKLRSDGSFVYGASIGAEEDDVLGSITTDSQGNLYVAGAFEGTVDFDIGADSAFFSSTLSNHRDAFVAKYDSVGVYLWTKTWGADAPYGTNAQGVTVDQNGNVYALGHFRGVTDFDPDPGVFEMTSLNNSDGFLTMFDPNGDFSWVRHLAANGNCWPQAVLTDTDGNIYSSGTISFYSADLDPSPDTLWAHIDGYDSFIQKLSYCPPTYGTDTVTICGPYYSTNGFYSWNESGVYTDWLTTVDGCDSLITLDLTILSTAVEIDTAVCEAFVSPSGLYTWTHAGTYLDTIGNSVGCDSIITINLDILTSYDTIAALACYEYTSPSGNYTWTNAGIYNDTIPNSFNCDSILTIVLDFAVSTDSVDLFACDSMLSPSGLYNWTNSGTYQDTLINVAGCDSILVITASIGFSSSSAITITECDSLVSPNGNMVWYASGIYQDTITSSTGCDSVITVELSIVEPDTSLSYSDNVLSSNQDSVSYQWLDCSNGLTPIVGANAQQLLIDSLGSFALEIDQQGCIETTECFDVSCLANFSLIPDVAQQHNWFALNSSMGEEPISYVWNWGDGDTSIGEFVSHTYDSAGYYNICLSISDAVGCNDTYCDNSTYIYKTMQMVTVNVVNEIPNGVVELRSDSSVVFYPNPTSDNIQIDLGSLLEPISINAYNMLGALVQTQMVRAGGTIEYNMPNEKGVYLIQLVSLDGRTSNLKVVKE